MFCTKCGKELPVNAKFCTGCGAKVESFKVGAMEQPTPSVQPVRPSNPPVQPGASAQQPVMRQTVPQTNPSAQTTPQQKSQPQKPVKKSEPASGQPEKQEKKSGGALVYLLIGAAVLIIILVAVIILLFIKGNQPAKQDDIIDKPVVMTEQATETEQETETRQMMQDAEKPADNKQQIEEPADAAADESTVMNENTAEENSDYIIPESASRLLTEDDLRDLSQEELRIARNEIYARHGRKFLDEALQEYFNGKSWYNGTIEPDDFKEDMLSEIERTNEDTIVNYETKMGYR